MIFIAAKFDRENDAQCENMKYLGLHLITKILDVALDVAGGTHDSIPKEEPTL